MGLAQSNPSLNSSIDSNHNYSYGGPRHYPNMVALAGAEKKRRSRDSKSDEWATSSEAHSLDFSTSSVCEKESSIASNYYDKAGEVTQLEN